MPLPRTARSTNSERTLLLVCRLAVKVHLYRADDVLDLVRLSVCLSVPCLRFTQNRNIV